MSRSNTLCNQKEIVFPEGEQLVSTTDLKGVITYCNPSFCRVAGYSEDELLGQNHNIIRHQDMPKAAFADLWARLREGNAWRGIVKNKAKSGDYYWVDAYVTPIYENGRITGYQSVRVKPKAHWVKIATTAYQQLLKAEKRGRRAVFALPDRLKYTALATACALPAMSNLLDGGLNMQAALSLTPVAVIGLLFRQELFDTQFA